LTNAVPRGELCSYLRAAITEQRRIDATYASHEGSISSSQAAALSVETRPDKEADIKLILPPEPQPAKGGKFKPQRKHRHTTKVIFVVVESMSFPLMSQAVYLEKITGFLQSAKSTLPVIAVDIPATSLAQLSLHTAWVMDDEAWKAALAEPGFEDRKYAETIREAVRKTIKEENQYVLWLVGVREGKEGKV
jgi:translation initiation factor 2-alpha kinase 4